MIIVIADDFTGAAELGGIGLRHHLRVEVNTRVNLQSTADLLVIATDTRSLKKADAIQIMAEVTAEAALLKPQLIYKKVDSVLRGHVMAELIVQLKALNLKRALLVPANPALGRIISDGTYFVDGRHLHLTGFAGDPDFPVKTSSVDEILSGHDVFLTVQKKFEPMIAEGISVAEVESEADLQYWAGFRKQPMLFAGGSGFFSALLEKLVIDTTSKSIQTDENLDAPALMVCGTAFHKSVETINTLQQNGGWVSYMPETVLRDDVNDERLYIDWSEEILSFIKKYGKAVIAINANSTHGFGVSANDLRNKISLIVKKVFEETAIKELLIEGGSTAFAVLAHLGQTELYPVQELSPGVIRMRTKAGSGLHITIKPGSYGWPLQIKEEILQK